MLYCTSLFIYIIDTSNQLSKNTTVQGLIDISDVVFELDILPSYTDIQELYPEFFL